MRSWVAPVMALTISATTAVAQPGYVPPKGYVPDAATAIAIARAVLIPIYGAKTIAEEEPLTATRRGNIWRVDGTMNCRPRCVGGVAELRLSAKDGRILYLMH